MSSLEQDLTAYLEVNHPELEPGSAEYVSYLVYDDGTLFMWTESSSWVNAADFYTYCVSKGAKIIKCNSLKSLQNTAKVGDIVQLKKSGGNWYHSIIISSGVKGALKYCGHTKNVSNKPLTEMSNIESIAQYRIIRF